MAEYTFAKTENNRLQNKNQQCFTYLNLLRNLENDGFTTIENSQFTIRQLKNTIEVNNNLMQMNTEIIDKYEQERREFSLCLLVTDSKKIYLSRRNNPDKDYYDY